MSKFKVGDRVKFIDDVEYSDLLENEVYTVSGLREKGVELKGKPINDWWFDYRFELVSEISEKHDTKEPPIVTKLEEFKIDLGIYGHDNIIITREKAEQLYKELGEML